MEELGDPRLSIVQRGRAGSNLGQVTLVVLTRPPVESGVPDPPVVIVAGIAGRDHGLAETIA